SPKLGEGELQNLLPSPKIGRGAVLVRVKPRKHALPNFYLKLTRMGNAVPLREIYMYQGFSEIVLGELKCSFGSLGFRVLCLIART
ncbi:MAG: hypothetical protein ACYTX0_35290, partial [Nostoc sp.]